MEKLITALMLVLLVSSASAFSISGNPINQYYNKALVIHNVTYDYIQTIGSNVISVKNGAFYVLAQLSGNNLGVSTAYTVQGFDQNQQFLGNLTYSIVNQNGTNVAIEIPHMPSSLCASLADAKACQAVEWTYAVVYYSPVSINPKQGNYCSKANPDPITGACPVKIYPNPQSLINSTANRFNLSINTYTTFYSTQYSYTGVVPVFFSLPYVFLANRNLADNSIVDNFNITYRPDAAHQYQIGEATINGTYFLQNLGLANFHCSWWIFGCGNAFVTAPAAGSLNANSIFYGKMEGYGYEGYFGSTLQTFNGFITYPILTETAGVDRNQSFMFNSTVGNVPISYGVNTGAGQWQFNIKANIINGDIINYILLPAFTTNYTSNIINLNNTPKANPLCNGGGSGWYSCQFQYRYPFINVSWSYTFNTLAYDKVPYENYNISLGNVTALAFKADRVGFLSIRMPYDNRFGGNCAQVQFDASDYTPSQLKIVNERGSIPFAIRNCTAGVNGVADFILSNLTTSSLSYNTFYMYFNTSTGYGEQSTPSLLTYFEPYSSANTANVMFGGISGTNSVYLVNITQPLGVHSNISYNINIYSSKFSAGISKYLSTTARETVTSLAPDQLFILFTTYNYAPCSVNLISGYSYNLGFQEAPSSFCQFIAVSNATVQYNGGSAYDYGNYCGGRNCFNVSMNQSGGYASVYHLFTNKYTRMPLQYWSPGSNATCTSCKLNTLPTQIAFNLNMTTVLFGIAIPVDAVYALMLLLFVFAFIIGSKSDMFILPIVAEVFGFVLLLSIGGFEVALLGALLMFMSYEFGRKVKVK